VPAVQAAASEVWFVVLAMAGPPFRRLHTASVSVFMPDQDLKQRTLFFHARDPCPRCFGDEHERLPHEPLPPGADDAEPLA